MPSRRKITLPDNVKRAVLDEIALDFQAWQEAEKRFKRRLYLGTEQGVFQGEIAERLSALPDGSATQQVVSKWRSQGEQYTRAISPDGGPVRPGEREPVG